MRAIAALLIGLLSSPALADQTINALSAGSALGGTEQIPMFQGSNPAVTTTPNALKTFIGGGPPLPSYYLSSNWYMPYYSGPLATGAATSINSIRCFYGGVSTSVTIKALGVNITGLSAGNNVQLAIYSHSGGTLTLIDSTASITTASTGQVSGLVANTTDLLSPGTLYAFCSNASGTAVFLGFSIGVSTVTPTNIPQLIGSATQANVIVNTSPVQGRSIAQAFGTWPATITESSMADIVSNTLPAIAFQVN